MATENFCKLINEICRLANIPNPELFHTTANLEIDKIGFTIEGPARPDDENLTFFCDFGLLPPANARADALQRLLELNLQLFSVNAAVFSINPESNHVILMARFPVNALSAKKLLEHLAEYAAKAKVWRQSYYLRPEGQALVINKKPGFSYQDMVFKRIAR